MEATVIIGMWDGRRVFLLNVYEKTRTIRDTRGQILFGFIWDK
jgi:hypothetical protein